MNKKKIIRMLALLVVIGLMTGGGIVYYLFNMPHRDIQASQADDSLTSAQLVNEYLSSPEKANEKYLDEEGESKILAMTGKVYAITEDLNNQKVVLLKEEGDKAGVSCTFTAATNSSAEKLQKGQQVTIKGVIRSGAGYDEDLDLYEDVIIEKCDVVN